jgi:hypothetical protein
MISFARSGRLARIALFACCPAFAHAQSTNAPPVLTTGDAPFDTAKLAPLPPAAKAAVAEATAKMKAGEISGFVFAASPGLTIWTLNAAPKSVGNLNIADLARTTLEACEYALGGACIILSINGLDTSLKNGGYANQPEMLAYQPSLFNAATIPFLTAAGRKDAAPYQEATGHRAFAVTTSGNWIWRGAPTAVQAIDKTMADCAAQFSNNQCVLYAVSDRVVFGGK